MKRLLVLVVLSASTAARAQGDFEKKLLEDAESCAAICAQDQDLLLFGGALTVPFSRPTVEKCGEWLSTPRPARAARLAELRRDAEHLASRQGYSARERELLRRKTGEVERKCEADYKRRCEEVKKSVPLARRKAALADVGKAIEAQVKEDDRATLRRYLQVLLTDCPLDQ